MNDKLRKIKLLCLDVDGVLTDGKIIFDGDRKETKNFDVKDGFGLVMVKKFGLKTSILTARDSKVVAIRAKDLHMDKVYLNAFPKIDYYEKMLKDFKVKDEHVCFVGDDWPDLAVLKRAGFAVAVHDAVPEVKKIADYITKKDGGHGAVREVIELILKAQGKWQKALAYYS